MVDNSNQRPIRIFPFVWCVTKPFRWLVFAAFFAEIVWAIDVSLRPYLVKIMLDRIPLTPHEQLFDTLWWPAIIYFFLAGFMVIISRLQGWLYLYLFPPLRQHLSLQLMEQMLKQSHSFYQNNFAGNLANKISDITYGVEHILKIFFDQLFCHALAIFLMIFTIWHVKPQFVWALLMWIMVFLAGSLSLSKTAQQLSDKAASLYSNVIGNIVDILGNMMNVRLFKGRKIEKQYLKKVLQESVQAEQKRDWFFTNLYTFQSGSFVIFLAACLWWLVIGLKNQTVTIGDFALILTLSISIMDSLWSLSHSISEFSEASGRISQGLRVIQAPLEIITHPEAPPLAVSNGEIVFDNVIFHYKGQQPLFKNLNVTITSGQKVGLVGYSGSGKTTFVNLILRLFEVDAGRIFIDNQNIREVTQSSLREAIGLIPQDPSLFHRSIMENIRYGRRGASDKEVIAAAKRAHAHEFIINLPQSYETLVGERGTKLSGGQRQRISIARAILKDAPILMMDEATSQLDSVTENLIQKSVAELMQGKTTLIIAHRLSTLLNMERILVFDQGQIVEDGTHDMLIAKDGFYKSLWDVQVGGFLPSQKNGAARVA